MERPGVFAVGIAPPRSAPAAPGPHRPLRRRVPATVDAGTPDGPTVMAVTARERVSETAARGWAAPRRAVSVLVVALISVGAVVAPPASGAEAGGTSGTGRPQPAPAPAEAGFAAPPVGNTFPVPAPHEVSFSDSWHACRDGCSRRHKGNDLMAAEGTPAVAVESGMIAKVTDEDVGKGGLSLWLLGDSGNAYYYAHNSANLVRVGQLVARGQVIARVGHTGNAATTPPHIHFQINRCGELSSDEPCTINPYELLRGWPQELVDGGADAIGWYTPVGSTFRLRTDGGSALPATRYGSPRGDVAVVGDWNGDGRDTVGVYRPADATFRLRDERGRSLAPVRVGSPGQTGMVALAGDWDGDRCGTASPVTSRWPATGTATGATASASTGRRARPITSRASPTDADPPTPPPRGSRLRPRRGGRPGSHAGGGADARRADRVRDTRGGRGSAAGGRLERS